MNRFIPGTLGLALFGSSTFGLGLVSGARNPSQVAVHDWTPFALSVETIIFGAIVMIYLACDFPRAKDSG